MNCPAESLRGVALRASTAFHAPEILGLILDKVCGIEIVGPFQLDHPVVADVVIHSAFGDATVEDMSADGAVA